MAQIEITEVGIRDGLQSEPEFIDTGKKIELANRIVNAGVRRIEATSFVSPKAVPQMADAEAMLAGIHRVDGLTLEALVPNVRGGERAATADLDVWVTFMSVSEKHSEANSNASVADAFARIKPLPGLAQEVGATVSASISVAFDCPFEGQTKPEKVIEVAKWFEGIGVKTIKLGDTIGSASPGRVKQIVEAMSVALPDVEIVLHFHNTRGLALANVIAGIEAGVTRFESSIGGVGGCPFAPGATGNVASEDLVHLLELEGHDTGIDINALIECGQYLSTVLDRGLPAHMQRAKPVGVLHEFSETSRAVG